MLEKENVPIDYINSEVDPGADKEFYICKNSSFFKLKVNYKY